MDSSIAWLIAGAFFVALEAFGISGIGFFFAGLSALVVALLVKSGAVGAASYAAQFIWFFALTAGWAVLLWKPMRKMRVGSGGGKHYNNILGEVAVIAEGGLRHGHGDEGQVKWSGTLMRAELAPDESAAVLEEGTKVVIVGVEGNKLFVKRKQ